MERIKLNLIPSGVAPIVHLSQYDDGRKFGIDLFEGESVYVLDGTETLTVNSRKPDGHVVVLTVTNTGTSSLDVDTVEQLTAVHGVSYAKLQIAKGSVTIATLPFLIDVSRDPLENGDPSESFIQNLRTQIADGVAEEVATQYDSSNVIFDTEPTDNHGIGYTVTSEGIKTAIDNAFDYDNTASGSLVHITDGADNIPVKSLVSQIVAVESGNGQPKSPDNPYTISGFDSGIITRCGKNLLGGLALGNAIVNAVNNPNASKFDSDTNGNFVTIDAGGATNNKNFTNGIRFKENTRYTLILRLTRYQTGTNLNSNISFHYTDGTQNTVYFSTTTASEVVTIAQASTEGKTLQYISTSFGGGTTRLFYEDSGIFEGVLTVGDYEVYNGNTYTFAFGQTVYGGHFDNKGNLVVTHGIKTFTGESSESWSEYPSYNGFHIAITDMNIGTRQNGLANRFVTTFDSSHTNNSCWFGVNSNRLFILECSGTTGATVADLKNWLANNNLTVIYPLANPIVLSITSQDIPTLLGENNIYSNCGDVEVDYYTSKSNDILEFINSEIGKKNGTNIPIEANSQDSIKDYVDNEVSSLNATNLPISSSDTTTTKDYVDSGLSGKADSTDLPFVKYQEIDVTFDASGEGTLFNSIKFVVGLKDIPSDQLYVGYVSYIAENTTKIKALSRTAIAFSSQNNVSSTRKVGVYYLDNIATQ